MLVAQVRLHKMIKIAYKNGRLFLHTIKIAYKN